MLLLRLRVANFVAWSRRPRLHFALGENSPEQDWILYVLFGSPAPAAARRSRGVVFEPRDLEVPAEQPRGRCGV